MTWVPLFVFALDVWLVQSMQGYVHPSRGSSVWGYFTPPLLHRVPSQPFRTPMEAMVDLTNDLGIAVLQDHSHSRGNFAFSPYGVASVLVVLYEGARGESARQIHRAVRFPHDKDIIRVGFRDIHRYLRSYFSHEGYLSGITLNKEGSSLKPGYKKILRFYGYDVDAGPPTDEENTGGHNATTDGTALTPSTPATTNATANTTVTAGSAAAGANATAVTTEPVNTKSTTASPTDGVATTTSAGDDDASTTSPTDIVATTAVIKDANSTSASTADSLSTSASTIANNASPTTTGIVDPDSSTVSPGTTEAPEITGESTNTNVTSDFPTSTIPTTTVTIDSNATSEPATDVTAATVCEICNTTSATAVVAVDTSTSTDTTSEESDAITTTAAAIESSFTTTTTTTTTTGTIGTNATPVTPAGVTTTVATITDSPVTATDAVDTKATEAGTDVIPTIDGEAQTNATTPVADSSESVNEMTSTVPSNSETTETSTQSGTTTEPGQEQADTKTEETTVASTTTEAEEVSTGGTTPKQPESNGGDDSQTTPMPEKQPQDHKCEENKETKNDSLCMQTEETGVGATVDESPTEGSAAAAAEQTAGPQVGELILELLDLDSEKKKTAFSEETDKKNLDNGMLIPQLDNRGSTNETERARAGSSNLKQQADTSRRNHFQARNEIVVRAPRSKRTIADYLKWPISPDLSLQLQNGMYDTHVSRNVDLYRSLPRLLFLVDGAVDTPVPMMTYTNIFPFGYVPRLHTKALEFPLDDIRYKLLILLPVERRGLRQLIYDLSDCPLRVVLESLRPTRVRATVPTFMVEGFVILTSTLQKLGIWDVFDPRKANLSGMSTDPELYVRNVEQSVTVVIRNYVEILDIQTRTMAARNLDHEFEASHPFLYFVLDAATNVALMAGQMLDPLNSRIY